MPNTTQLFAPPATKPVVRGSRPKVLFSTLPVIGTGHRRGSDAEPAIHIEDSCLLERIANGDQSAFWILWGRYHPDLFWTYHRLCKGNRQDIHDCLSGLSITLLETLPLYARSIIKCRTWLRRTAVNHFIDTHRAHRRYPVLVGSLIELADLSDGLDDRAGADPEQASADRSLLLKVLGTLDDLGNPRLRQAAHKRFIEEQSYTEIATAMGVSQDLVRKWIQQVRAHLRSRMPDHRDAFSSARPRRSLRPTSRSSR